MNVPKPTPAILEARLQDYLAQVQFLLDREVSIRRALHALAFWKGRSFVPKELESFFRARSPRYWLMFAGPLREIVEIPKKRLMQLSSALSNSGNEDLTCILIDLYLRFEMDGFWKVKSGSVALVVSHEDLSLPFEGERGALGLELVKKMDARLAEQLLDGVSTPMLHEMSEAEKCQYDHELDELLGWLRSTLEDLKWRARQVGILDKKIEAYVGANNDWPRGVVWLRGSDIRNLLDNWGVAWRKNAES